MKSKFDTLVDHILSEASIKPKAVRNYWQESMDAAVMIKPLIAMWVQNTFDASKEQLEQLKAALKFLNTKVICIAI